MELNRIETYIKLTHT